MKYKYVVQCRFHSEIYCEPTWHTISHHTTRNGAKEMLDWELSTSGAENMDFRIMGVN